MKTSFKAGKSDAAAAAPEAESTELAESQGQTRLGFPTQQMEGEISQSDLQIPTLQIVQSIGQMSETFDKNHGAIVYAKELLLNKDGKDPVKLTVLRIKKQYIENLPFQEDNIGLAKVFDKLDDVKAAGGTIEWGENNERPSYIPIARALVMVEAPDLCKEDPLMAYEFGGSRYAPALWTLRGTSYTRAAKTIFTARQFALKDGYEKGYWTLSTRREKIKSNWVYVPVLRHGGKNSEEFQKWLLENSK